MPRGPAPLVSGRLSVQIKIYLQLNAIRSEQILRFCLSYPRLGLYRILIWPDIRPLILSDARLNNKYRIFSEKFLVFIKAYQNFWSLFHSYFVYIEKVLKQVSLFIVRIICSTSDPDIQLSGKWNRISGRLPNIEKSRISDTILQTLFQSDCKTKIDKIFFSYDNFLAFVKNVGSIYWNSWKWAK